MPYPVLTEVVHESELLAEQYLLDKARSRVRKCAMRTCVLIGRGSISQPAAQLLLHDIQLVQQVLQLQQLRAVALKEINPVILRLEDAVLKNLSTAL